MRELPVPFFFFYLSAYSHTWHWILTNRSYTAFNTAVKVSTAWLIGRDRSKKHSIRFAVRLYLDAAACWAVAFSGALPIQPTSAHAGLCVDGFTQLRLWQQDAMFSLSPLNFIPAAWRLFMIFSLAIFVLSPPISFLKCLCKPFKGFVLPSLTST